MPELPEVESIRRALEPVLTRATVRAVDVRRRDVVRGAGRERRAPLLGATIGHLDRRGKVLWIVADDGRTMAVRLGMSGRLTADCPDDADAPHAHVVWRVRTVDGANVSLVFRDPRRFGGVAVYTGFDGLRAAELDRLGPDALTLPARTLLDGVTRSRRAIKAALLDQSLLAGVGNIYADEALFRARIRPTRSCATLKPHELASITASIRSVLRDAIRAGGSTIRDFAGASGAPGRYQSRHAVYGRAGLPCPECGRALVGVRVAQRITTYCETCQPARTPR